MDKREKRAREGAKALADLVNEMGFDHDSFSDELLRQHRMFIVKRPNGRPLGNHTHLVIKICVSTP